MQRKWAQLTPKEKREERFKSWLWPGIEFASPQAERLYQERITRFIDVIQSRVFGGLAPLRELHPLTDIIKMPATAPSLVPYGSSEVQAALEALIAAGREGSSVAAGYR